MQTDDVAKEFYGKILGILLKSKIPFLIGGGFAVFEYTGFNRPTNDLDIFCKGGDFPKVVAFFKNAGVEVNITDDRWLAKVSENNYYVDLLYSSPNYLINVDDVWFKKGKEINLFGHQVKLMPKEELIWCKAYIWERDRFDGADINHIILMNAKDMDWKRLLARMENGWEILLALLINFRYIYPSERDLIPKWLMSELIARVAFQLQNPSPQDKICRGPLLSRSQYKVDITKLGFQTIT